MEHFELQSNECVLYKGNVTLSNKKGNTQLLLTNLNIVFITKTELTPELEEINVETFTIEQLKVYEGKPQIHIKGHTAEFYFTTGEREVTFPSKNELHKFNTSALKLITGKTTAQRNAEKVKNAINLVDDTLGINSVQIAGNAIKSGATGKATGLLGKSIALIGKIGKKK